MGRWGGIKFSSERGMNSARRSPKCVCSLLLILISSGHLERSLGLHVLHKPLRMEALRALISSDHLEPSLGLHRYPAISDGAAQPCLRALPKLTATPYLPRQCLALLLVATLSLVRSEWRRAWSEPRGPREFRPYGAARAREHLRRRRKRWLRGCWTQHKWLHCDKSSLWPL